MTALEIIVNVFIGLATGTISGIVVSVSLKKYWDGQQFKRDFEEDKQMYERYLDDIRLELQLAENTGNYDEVCRKINAEPVRKTFAYLQNHEKQKEINEYVRNLKEKINENPMEIQRHTKRICSKLYEYRVAVLKYKMEE